MSTNTTFYLDPDLHGHLLSSRQKTDILLVDDTPENLLGLEELLQGPGLNFIKASSGEEALEVTLSARPALILLDVQMPGMDGFEVARLLRSTQRTREIPIIFVTATERDEKFTFKGFESGAVDYLFKPLNPVIVRSKVKVFVELHRNQMRLEKAVRELNYMNKELESFSYSVSHDLRAPLRAILGFSQNVMVQLEKANDIEKVKTLSKAISAAEKMNHLIDGLLDLAQVTGAKIQSGNVNLTDIAHQICQELTQDPVYTKVQVVLGQDVMANGDRRLLESVLRNLIGNAFKYCCKSKNAQVEFGSLKNGKEITYFVRDNGVGFDMKFADRLFGVFQRLHSEKEFSGLGIGLATVQRILHRHGGRIWAESKPNESTCFYFTLS
jgi:hypothetical protein